MTMTYRFRKNHNAPYKLCRVWFWILVVVAPMISSVNGQFRDFRNQEGKVIKAMMIRKSDTHATLVTPQDKQYEYEIAKLSEADQEFVAQWNDIGDFMYLPGAMRARCSATMDPEQLTKTGATAESEKAVMKALRWMKSTQAPDGSWGEKNKSAMTGLALLAYLGNCKTPLSEEFGETVLKAVVFLTSLNHGNGKLSQNTGDKFWPYEHAIATQALAEMLCVCKQLSITIPNLNEITQKAGQFLIDHQHESGSWDYGYDQTGPRGGDLSIAAWHVEALKALQWTGLPFNNHARCMEQAMRYIANNQHAGGGFGYTSQKSLNPGLFSLTGAGVLGLQYSPKAYRAQIVSGSAYIAQTASLEWGTPDVDLYSHYFMSIAMKNQGGDHWKKYNAVLRDELIKNQNDDGTWKNPEGKLRAMAPMYQGTGSENVIYRTALCTLMLEVYYRYSPTTP